MKYFTSSRILQSEKCANIYCVVRFLAHWMANCTIVILVWINCQVQMCPGHLRPLSVIAEKVPNNYIFAFGMGTSALLTVVLVVTLHVSVTNFIKSRAGDLSFHEVLGVESEEANSIDRNQYGNTVTFTARELQLKSCSTKLCVLGSVSYVCLFFVTITHAHKQGFAHSFFGVIHFFTSWGYSLCVQMLRLCLLDTYNGRNDVDGLDNPKGALVRFKISQYMLLALMFFDLAFGTLWIYVNVYASQRHKYMGLESVLEVVAVLIQINYCCSNVFDSPGQCSGSGANPRSRHICKALCCVNIHDRHSWKRSQYSHVLDAITNPYQSETDSSYDDSDDETIDETLNFMVLPDKDKTSIYRCTSICRLFLISILPCIPVGKYK